MLPWVLSIIDRKILINGIDHYHQWYVKYVEYRVIQKDIAPIGRIMDLDNMTKIELITIIIQCLTLIALIFYVAKTWEMASATREYAKISEKTLQEMRDARDQEIAPYVIAYFDVILAENRIEFVIKNNGKSMATDILIKFDPLFQAPPTSTGAPTTEELMNRMMPDGKILSLPPDHEIRTVISSFLEYREGMKSKDSLPGKYKITVIYHGGIIDKPRKAEYISDIGMYSGVAFIRKPNRLG